MDLGHLCQIISKSDKEMWLRPASTTCDFCISHGTVPTHVVTLTQVGTSVYLGQTHLGTPFQVPAWVRKFSLGSTGDQIFSLIIIQSSRSLSIK